MIDNLIKSEAEKHVAVMCGDDNSYISNNVNRELMKQAYRDGANFILEMAKMDNEEMFEKWMSEPIDSEMDRISSLRNAVIIEQELVFKCGWLDATQFKDVELMAYKEEINRQGLAYLDLYEKNKQLEKMLNCTYSHQSFMNDFYCNKCGYSKIKAV
jgi:hypothetical protein